MSLLSILISSNIASSPIPLFVKFGESNARGNAPDSEVSSNQLGNRTAIQLLNNTGLTNFYTANYPNNVHIGEELFGQVGINTHAWDLEFANRIDAGTFVTSPTYWVFGGQGGTKIADWFSGGTPGGIYYNALIHRINAAKSLLQLVDGYVDRPIYVTYSQGINDILGSTLEATWKASTISLINQFRSDVGYQAPFLTTLFMQSHSNFNWSLSAYAFELDDIIAIDGYDLEGIGTYMIDQAHWNSAGMQILGDRMVDSLLNHYITPPADTTPASPPSAINWGQVTNCNAVNGTLTQTGIQPAGATATQKIGNSGCYLEFTIPSPASNADGTLIHLTTFNDGLYDYTSFHYDVKAGILIEGGILKATVSASTKSFGAVSAGDVIRLERQAGNIVLKKNGIKIYTFYSLMLTTQNMYIKGIFKTGSSKIINSAVGAGLI